MSFVRTVIVVIAAGWLPSAVTAAAEQAYLEQSRALAKSLMESLKTELQAAMQSGGPVEAIGVCQAKAGSITAATQRQGWTIRRTSLRVRNPANRPDPWEQQVLQQFESRQAAGEDPRSIEHHAIVEQGGGKVFRWLKAIPTVEVCVTCHGGENVPAAVVQKIDALYPQDQARGFRVGDIRGAFSVTGPID